MALFAASIDAPETNRKFAESLGLGYPILSDPDKKTAKAYGVLKTLGLYAARHTVYISATGEILLIDKNVKPTTAGADMIRQLEKLKIPRKTEK